MRNKTLSQSTCIVDGPDNKLFKRIVDSICYSFNHSEYWAVNTAVALKVIAAVNHSLYSSMYSHMKKIKYE